MNNDKYMKRCYELAVQAGKKGFDTFGAVLVHDGEILEEAENTADWKKEEWFSTAWRTMGIRYSGLPQQRRS